MRSIDAMVERNLFTAKINSEYNDFVARVALEVVDSAWWKQQLRVKSAGSGRPVFIEQKGIAVVIPRKVSKVALAEQCIG